MSRVSLVSTIFATLSAASASAQHYPPFLHEAEQALADEFQKMEQQDWPQWRQHQEGRLRQADDDDNATCWRLEGRYPYGECRAKLLGIRRECAQVGDFFDLECD